MEFKSYFQDELAYLRDAGDEFSRLNPKLGRYLAQAATDPDMERLLEGFAFLSARLRQDLDSDLPELTQSVLRMVWPGFLRPFPPLTLIHFSPIDRAITTRHVIERDTLVRAEPEMGTFCDFLTTADSAIYPLEISAIETESSGVRSILRLRFRALSGVALQAIGLADLRLWLTNPANAETLYLYCQRACKTMRLVSANGDVRVLPSHSLTPGGFSTREALLPGANPAFDGYRLLMEYFAYRQKFLCLDFSNIGSFAGHLDGEWFSIEFEFARPLPAGLVPEAQDIRLHCAPAVNLFPVEIFLQPGRNPGEEDTFWPETAVGNGEGLVGIFSIDEVSSWRKAGTQGKLIKERGIPCYESTERQIEAATERREIYYRETQAPRVVGRGSVHALVFCLGDGTPVSPDFSPGANMTCFDATLAPTLPVGSIGTFTGSILSFVRPGNLTVPAPPLYCPVVSGRDWALISTLVPNMPDIEHPEILQDIVRLFDYRATADREAERALNKRLTALETVRTKPIDRLFSGRPRRGLHVHMGIRDGAFDTAGELFLFATVLSEFLALYATANSFVRLEVQCMDSGETYAFPERVGRQPLL